MDFDRCERFADFDVVSFTAAQWPAGAFEAQQVQAACYLAMGYVRPEALQADGRLHEELDHSRCDPVTYIAALDGDGRIQASIRLAELDSDAELSTLSSYRHAFVALSEEARSALERLRRSKTRIYDGSALCKLPSATATASYAVIREAIRQGIRAEGEVVWLMTLTTSAWQILQAAFGSAMWRVGTEISTESGDDRVIPTKVVPAMASMKAVPTRLVEDIERASDPVLRAKLARTLGLIVGGLEDRHLGVDPSVRARIQSHLAATTAPSGGSERPTANDLADRHRTEQASKPLSPAVQG